MSLRGYWRTLRERIACSPAMRITRLTTTARTGRLMNRSVNRISVVLGLGRRVVAGLHVVGHLDGRSVAQLERAGAGDLLAFLHSGEHCDLVAAGTAELDELLAHATVGLALRPLHVA